MDTVDEQVRIVWQDCLRTGGLTGREAEELMLADRQRDEQADLETIGIAD